MYSKAIEWGKVKETPVKKVKLLKGEVKRVRFLLPAEIQALLSNCADHLRPIVTVALHTGMRKSELLNLRRDQLNFEQGIITLEDTKNHERRDIPMNETVKAMLQGIEKKGGYLFVNEEGQTFANVRKSFDTAVRKSGITDFRFHDLRHTFASNLVMDGVDIMTVKELMGHKDLTMTLRYAHLAPNHKSRAVNILDRLMPLNPPHPLKAAEATKLSI
jgi:integrase